jgi:hypothetical protein
MHYHKTRRLILLGGAALLLAGSALLTGGGRAHAASACRSDPVITLSDLRVLDMSATIDDGASDVTGVKYVLHGPVGVSIILVVRTPSLTYGVESFSYVADQPTNTYVMDTTVTTSTTKASVTASTTLVSVLTNKTLYISSATGYAGTTITMPFHDNSLL